MIATNMSFALDKSEDGQMSYKLDPYVLLQGNDLASTDGHRPRYSPIDVFVHFEGKRATDITPGRFAVRQMILREVCFPVFHGEVFALGIFDDGSW